MRKLLLLLLALFLSITATISPASYHITSKITPKRMEQGESLPSDSLSLSSGSAVLMEASTGTILYEKDSATKRPPASVTKVMSMLLIFDAISSGKIRPSDPVTVSEHAAGMGGSPGISGSRGNTDSRNFAEMHQHCKRQRCSSCTGRTCQRK